MGQLLEYKGIIENHNPAIKTIDLYLLGYDVHSNMPKGLMDLKIDLLENVINRKRNEFDEFLKIVEENKETDQDIF